MPASLTSSASVPPVPGLTNGYCAAVGRPAAAQDVLLDLARGRLGQLVDELNSWPSTLCRGYIEASPTLGRRSLPRACYLETSVHPARVPLRLPRGIHHPEDVGPRASCAERCQAGGGARFSGKLRLCRLVAHRRLAGHG